jgi:hypothetical protein
VWYLVLRDSEASLQAGDVSLHSEKLFVALRHTGFKHLLVGLLQTHFGTVLAVEELWIYHLK